MWALILTLTAVTTNGGNSITSVPGFRSAEACHAAANEWMRQQRQAVAQPSAVCARQD
jgi:hypothetical protein